MASLAKGILFPNSFEEVHHDSMIIHHDVVCNAWHLAKISTDGDCGPGVGAHAKSRLGHRRHGTQFSDGGEYHRKTRDKTRQSVFG